MQKLSDREWMVLEALWQMGDAELGTLVEQLRPHTDWNRNTVLTYLTRMEAKGLVWIDKEAVPHRYQAGVDRETCRAQERRSFLNRVYQGAAGDLVAAFPPGRRRSCASCWMRWRCEPCGICGDFCSRP